jgi:hypothetical protein
MRTNEVSFSIAGHAAWAPGIESPDAWAEWAKASFKIHGNNEPGVRQMPAMLRRRAGFLGKMALEVAYQCTAGRTDIPTVFCSRHGEVVRAVELLTDLAQDAALSPTGFGLAVHNASAGLFSIARADRANHVALAAGSNTIEHAVIEACSLLADGASEVLLVAYENCLPPVFAQFEDFEEQPYAWAWLMVAADENPVRLSWSATDAQTNATIDSMPPGLAVLQFQLRADSSLERIGERRRWRWTRDA